MADDDNITESPIEAAVPTPCMPCRGTGKVVSNLGGAASTIECPWCRGSGMRTPDIDAQSAWLTGEGDQQETPPEN